MKPNPIDADAFNTFEAAGWQKQASGYERFFGSISPRVVDALLDATAVGPLTRLLDVASGPGYVASRAAQRGAPSVIGVDIAPAMIALARRLHPELTFLEGDAHALPFRDQSFDAVTGNFIVHHLGRPEHAATEFVRALAPGGKLALTAWDKPDRARFLGVMLDAFKDGGGTPPQQLPAGPDFFRFSSEEGFSALLAGSGLVNIVVQTLTFTHRVTSVDELWDGLMGGTVRTSALIEGQSEATRQAIRAAFDERAEEYRRGDGYDLPVAVKLASGQKPA